MTDTHRERVRAEFERVASTFGDRTRGRFDHMKVLEFSRVKRVNTVVEVGAGTGNFLALFRDVARRLVAVDVTPAMLADARKRYPGMGAAVIDGERLPFADGSIDLVTCAQMIHHVPEPVPLLREMARVTAATGSMLVVDQVATEDPSEAEAMSRLELIRDPSHARSRPPSEYRKMLSEAGLDLLDEKIVERRETFSSWMPPHEFPEDRIAAVVEFIEEPGDETGLDFRKEGDEVTYLRRRIMLLARPILPRQT